MLIDARLTDFKSVHFLRDAWWLKHPRERQFTWLSSNLSFLLSCYLCQQVVSCEIRPCVYLDHDFVYIELNLRNVSQQGPIVWNSIIYFWEARNFVQQYLI